ncbi:MAG: nitroreductase family deazaflavin-dependent oxidoreductase [Solirubrobacterales bacterium]|nr:nitroreductase family deazaflavin-dependent oxidoreductase [Solirubrobacterales bacterium]MBV9472979.1 nitroreductase family deazaflavin-dependent oxidoreductase [Solirubrobacterales bacterium]
MKVALGQPILLLHTRGAKSGEPRQTPLLYTPDNYNGYQTYQARAAGRLIPVVLLEP